MSQIKQDIATILKENGYSVTKQRLYIFHLFEGKDPLTMNELYTLAQSELDRATVYRIVTLYEKLGVIQRVNIGWKYKLELSDRFAEHHHHLTCLNCHQVIPISEVELESFIKGLTSSYHFKPIDHQVEVQGYCENCVNR